LAEEVVPVDVLMRISFRTESDATRDNTAEQNIRGFRPMSAAISACRNLKLCPCLLALDCWRITGNPSMIRVREGLPTILELVVDKIRKHERDRVRRDLLDYCHAGDGQVGREFGRPGPSCSMMRPTGA